MFDVGLTLQVDMLVGDIYGDRDYSNIGLSATTIASSFGKVVSEGKDLEDIDPADIALALCRCALCLYSLTVQMTHFLSR